jgi:hypothetical protein
VTDDKFHPTVELVTPDGEHVDIDVDIAPVIQQLWQAGLTTVSCCQDVGEALSPTIALFPPHIAAIADRDAGYAIIEFSDIEDAGAFLSAIANAGPRDAFYVRMIHWAAPGAWHSCARLTDLADDADDEWSQFVTLGASVKFPRTDLPEILARLRRTSLYPRGPVDWSTVEIRGDDV